jgi:hypothetical protein
MAVFVLIVLNQVVTMLYRHGTLGMVMTPVTVVVSIAVTAHFNTHTSAGLALSHQPLTWKQKQIRYDWNLLQLAPFRPCPILDSPELADTMRRILLAAVAVLAFAAPSFAAEPAKTVGQAPPVGAFSFYLAQDTATMKCQVVDARPAADSGWKIIGAAHTSQADAQTALAVDKTCK